VTYVLRIEKLDKRVVPAASILKGS